MATFSHIVEACQTCATHLLAHPNHDSLMPRSPNNGRKHRTRGVISGKTCLHCKATVNLRQAIVSGLASVPVDSHVLTNFLQ